MNQLQTFTLMLAALVPILLIILLSTSAFVRQLFPGKIAAYTLLIFGIAWLCASVALGLVIANGSVNYTLATIEQTPVIGFLIDRLSLIVLLLITTISGIVHLYSLKAMQEERHFSRYFSLLSLVTIEVLLVVLANNLLLLAIFWIAKGFTLTFLLAHYQERAASWRAAFTKLRIDLLGAVSFVLALVVCWNIFGTFDIQAINARATQVPQSLPADQLTLLTILLFGAAMAKSAQFPLHGWLPHSLEAPTPVSALMHAGLINAGGFLLVRLSPLFVAAPFTLNLVILVGGFTAFYGTLVMLTRNDVKGKLVYSTMGQMGFMMLQCGLGAFGLATFHIVAHGLFKATLFLSSGSVIQKKAETRHLAPPPLLPQTPFSNIRFLFASLLAAWLVFALPPLLGSPLNTDLILLSFAWITIFYALPRLVVYPFYLVIAGLTSFILLYLAGTKAIEQFFIGTVATHPAVDSGLVILGSGLLVLLGSSLLWLQNAPRPPWIHRMLAQLYVRLLFTGHSK